MYVGPTANKIMIWPSFLCDNTHRILILIHIDYDVFLDEKICPYHFKTANLEDTRKIN